VAYINLVYRWFSQREVKMSKNGGDKMKRIIFGLLIMLLSFPLLTMADEHQVRQADPASKLAYGITEVAFSWTEIPQSIYYYSKKHDPISGLFLGVAEGTVLGLRDVVEGTIDTTFFLLPPYKTKGKSFFEKLKDWDDNVSDHLW
jgi:putative exosortase-associated protein (TIGR04073 family)|tara:strand:- start:7931 stop:8365 length:435 start_codon:yes stop_codon:yes gene_type:complete